MASDKKILVPVKTSADWGDPKDASPTTATSTTETTGTATSGEADGISIPAFLQPLLGLDFVPYLPRPTTTTTTTTTTKKSPSRKANGSPKEGPTQDDSLRLDRLNLNAEDSTPSTSGLAWTRSNSDPVFLDALRPPASATTTTTATTPMSTAGYSSTPTLSNRGSGDDELGGGLDPFLRESITSLASSSNRRTWMHRVRGKIDGRGKRRGASKDAPHNSDSEKGVPTSGRKSKRGGDKKYDASTMEWIQQQNARLTEHQSHLANIQIEAQVIKTRASDIHSRIGETQKEMARLRKAMIAAESKLRRDCEDFDQTQQQLLQLQRSALRTSQAVVEYLQQIQDFDSSDGRSGDGRRSPSQRSDISEFSYGGESYDGPSPTNELGTLTTIPSPTPESLLRPRAATAPAFGTRAESFMRVDDLDLTIGGGDEHECSSLPGDGKQQRERQLSPKPGGGLIFVDHHIVPILQKLTELGYSLAVDESDRFVPTKDTEKILGKYPAGTVSQDDSLVDWPIESWKAPRGTDILIWTGDIGHSGFGSDWPVVKARCLVKASPRILIEYMMDSSKTKEYNKMSQGREDLVRIQEGLDTTAAESFFGFDGDCKIIKSLNKPRLLPKAIESVSLMYSKPLENTSGSYMTVTRSVFEDSSGEHKATANNTIRTETLIGVSLYRPVNKDQSLTEFTSITHVFSPGVPEMLARRAAPGSALNMLKEIQNVFAKNP